MVAAVGVIVGSTRPACNGKPIAAWIYQLAQQRTVSGDYTYELVDLAQWNLPLFDEPGKFVVPVHCTAVGPLLHDASACRHTST